MSDTTKRDFPPRVWAFKGATNFARDNNPGLCRQITVQNFDFNDPEHGLESLCLISLKEHNAIVSDKDAEMERLRKAVDEASNGIESALRLDEKLDEAWDDLKKISNDLRKALSHD